MDVPRRTLLAAVGSGAAGTAGCVDGVLGGPSDDPAPNGSDDRSPTATDRPLPEDCPTSQDLAVEWPETPTEETVASFVEDYENAYYREVVVNYEPESTVDEYGLEAVVTDGPVAVDGGYEVALSGNGGVYHPTLHLRARTADPPADADVVPFDEVEDEVLRDLLETAAAEGEAEHHVEPPGERVDRYIERVVELSADFEPLEEPGDEDTAYFDADGTSVALTLQASNFHGDYWWGARYYVDEHVVWRVDDPEGEPRNGELLECRTDRDTPRSEDNI